jgi:hypothetical protein
MNELIIFGLLIQCVMIVVFTYLIVNISKKQQMMVNGLSHVWGQLNEINIQFKAYAEVKEMGEWEYDVEPPIVPSPNNTFNTPPSENESDN